MDAGDATPLGSLATVRGYFTPATLFLVLNLVIGTIALTSRSHQRRRREHLHDYAHPAHYQAPPLDPHHHQQQQEEYNNYYQPQPPAPLARTSSVLDRLRSIGLYRFRSGDFPPEYGAGAVPSAANHDVFAPVEEELTTKQASRSEPAPAREEKKRAPPRTKKPAAAAEARKAQVARPPARSRVVEAAVAEDVVDARAEQFVAGFRQPEPASPPKAEYHYQAEEEYVPPPAPMRAPPPLSRTSSVLERLRSISIYSFLGADQPPAGAATTDAFMNSPADDKKPAPAHPTHYDRSRSEPAREQGKKEKKQAAEAKMAKSSSSAARKPAAPKLVEEECVDARAEAFIDSFRRGQSQKQLHHPDADEEDHAVVPPPAPLVRTSSVLDRLRSFSLYLRSGDAVPEDPVINKADEKQQQQAQYARSRSEPAAKKKQGAAAAAKMSKASSVAAAPAEECVDARADDFINKFRQQLQLQRLNSLLGGSKQ